MHVLCIDGVYLRANDGALGFHALPEPTVAEVADVAARTAARVARLLRKHGRDLDEPSSVEYDTLQDRQPVLASCYRVAIAGQQLLGQQPGQPVLRLMVEPKNPAARQAKRLVAQVRGFNVHAERFVDGRDRPQLERLCRYLARPALSNDRLQRRPDGRLRLELKTPWSDGTTAIVLAPLDLIVRVCSLVPPPRFNLTRFHGVLGPAAKLRSQVVPAPPPQALSAPVQLPLFGTADSARNASSCLRAARLGRSPER
jgi:hypothetical protein